jgi:hypothetical protein
MVDRDVEYQFDRGLCAYFARVAAAVGVGFESCSFDLDVPSSGYLALDRSRDDLPRHEVALVWDEVHGWAVVVEPAGGGATQVFAYLGGPDILPPPGEVARFLAAVRGGVPSAGVLRPPALRVAGHHENLVEHLPRPAALATGWGVRAEPLG